MVDALWTDLRLAVRALRGSPGFSLVVVITCALAIGVNTTVFSLLNAIVLRTVPAQNPDGLVSISAADPRTNQRGFIYADTFIAFRTQQQSFSRLSMYSGGGVCRIEVRGMAVDAGVEGIMPEYFDLLGVRAAAGRLLTDADQALDVCTGQFIDGSPPWRTAPFSRVLALGRSSAGTPHTAHGKNASRYPGRVQIFTGHTRPVQGRSGASSRPDLRSQWS